MEYRHWPNSSTQMFRTDQDQSHVTAQRSHVRKGKAVAPENVSTFYPTENAMVDGPVCASQWGLECRPVTNSLSSVRLESPIQGAYTGPAFDPFSRPVARSYHQTPANNLGHAHTSYYNNHFVHEVAGLVGPTTGTRRGQFKRKSPSVSVASDRGICTFSGAGSSSSSTEIRLERSTNAYQTSADSRRNVRSRSRLDLEPTPRGAYLSNYANHYSPTTHLPTQSGAVGVTNVSAIRNTQEQNHAVLFPAANSRIVNSENYGLNQELHQFPIGGSTSENGGYCHDSVPRRNLLPPPLQYVPDHAVRDTNCNNSQRDIRFCRARLSFSSLGREAVPSENGPPYRCTRLPSARGWSRYRNERSRIATQRSVSLSDAEHTRDRVGSEASMRVDHSLLYGSRNSFDRHRDLRIDVDNMSYEELLALGERIGHVSTGLSKDTISKCLVTTCSSSDDKLNEKCAICLEEYKSKEEVGTVKNCGHKYHDVCIKEWLLVKNACPICKAPALESDTFKDQQ